MSSVSLAGDMIEHGEQKSGRGSSCAQGCRIKAGECQKAFESSAVGGQKSEPFDGDLLRIVLAESALPIGRWCGSLSTDFGVLMKPPSFRVRIRISSIFIC